MCGFKDGSIILDEERGIYYAGQVLTGRVEFSLNQPLTFKAITVEFHGEANVCWEEDEFEEYNGVQTIRTVQYVAREEYLNVVHCVCGGVGVSQLPARAHSVPFRCQLPPGAPSTFRGGDVAELKYWVKACLQSVDGRQNVELQKVFEVVVPLDLNLDPEMKKPVLLELEEAGASCACGAGALAARVRLPAAGACPAQRVPVAVAVVNNTAREVRKILFQLVQRDTYRSRSPPSQQTPPERVLAAGALGPVLARTTRDLSYELVAPDMLAPVLDNCGVIDVRFYFKVKLKMSGCADDQDDEAEIRLGFVPIHELSQGQYVHPLQSDLPKGPIPDLDAPPQFVLSDIYPSLTLEKGPPAREVTSASYPSCPPNAPYPGFNSPYPGIGYPYTASGPYPSREAPYPSDPPPYSPGPIGFKVTGPRYPSGPAPIVSPTFQPTAPSAPSS